MAQSGGDVWSDWLGRRRDGGSPARRLRTLDRLAPIRDQVLAGAAIAPGDVVVDVGCGDGMLGLAALARVGESGRVVFLDVSAALLDRCQAGAARARPAAPRGVRARRGRRPGARSAAPAPTS